MVSSVRVPSANSMGRATRLSAGGGLTVEPDTQRPGCVHGERTSSVKQRMEHGRWAGRKSQSALRSRRARGAARTGGPARLSASGPSTCRWPTTSARSVAKLTIASAAWTGVRNSSLNQRIRLDAAIARPSSSWLSAMSFVPCSKDVAEHRPPPQPWRPWRTGPIHRPVGLRYAVWRAASRRVARMASARACRSQTSSSL